MRLWFEKWYPPVGALLTCAAWVLLRRAVPLPLGTMDVFRAVVTAAAMGLGFLMTTTSILLSLNERWIIRRSRQEGAYALVVDYLISACRWCLSLAFFSAAALFVDARSFVWWHAYAFAVWLGLAVGTVLAVYRIVYFLTVILRSVSSPDDRR